jgi:ribonuclease D
MSLSLIIYRGSIVNQAYLWTDQPESWADCLSALQAADRFAVDLEANSLHAYREQICLIQISTEDQDYIIDPLAGLDLSGFGALLADPSVEKVFHAADYDMALLKGLYGWELRHLFDTMWAGRVLGCAKMGLVGFIEDMFGLKLSKKHQKADWARRPLTEEMLEYAKNDTHFLLRLRDDFERRLREAGLYEEAMEIFGSIVDVDPSERIFDPESFWRIRGVRELPPRGQAILRALFVFREEEASRRDTPPFKVINDAMLLRIAQHTAGERGAVEGVPGVSDKLLGRLGSRLQQAVNQGRRDPLPKQPRRPAPRQSSPGFSQRYEALLEMRKRLARERGVESDVILARRTAVEIAEKNPRVAEDLEKVASLGPYRRNLYARDILQALALEEE